MKEDFFCKNRKNLYLVSFFVLFFFFGICLSNKAADQDAHITPDYAKEEILSFFEEKSISEEYYIKILLQTGLGKPVVDALREERKAIDADMEKSLLWKKKVKALQEIFFQKVQFVKKSNLFISCEEVLIDEDGQPAEGISFVNLQEGDILITKSSRIYGWRNGHAALVIDSKNEKTLESVVLGENSSIQDLNKWRAYPNVMVYRLKGVNQEVRKKIADWAVENLEDQPYRLTVGLFSEKEGKKGKIEGTQCAHLVWAAYKKFGYDLDGNGGKIVMPKDLAHSSELEIVQLYGVNPQEPWK